METNQNQTTTAGYCVNELTASGTFLMLAENGNLMKVTQMIQERASIGANLETIERKLLSCNNPLALARYARWCETRKKDFCTELKQLAEKLETKKRELTLVVQQIDEQLAQQNLRFEWTITTTGSLIPAGARPLNPSVLFRNTIIDQNQEKSGLDICRILDSNFRETERPPGFLPESWQEKCGVKNFVDAYHHLVCGNLVQKMISSRRTGSP